MRKDYVFLSHSWNNLLRKSIKEIFITKLLMVFLIESYIYQCVLTLEVTLLFER